MRAVSRLLFICVTTLAFASSAVEGIEQKSLIVDMNTAIATRKPIFDCAGIYERIMRAWRAKCRPCNTGTREAIMAFKIDQNDHAYDIRLLKSSGYAACDQTAKEAIERANLFYVPTGNAEFVFDFNSNVKRDPSGRLLAPKRIGVSLQTAPGEPEPRVSFISHDRYPHTELNNKGVVQFLLGDYEAARQSFEESMKCDSTYQPAAHNLDLLRRLFK